MRVNHSGQASAAVATAPAQLQKACIDRFEKTQDGRTLAVLLVGNEEKVMDVDLKSLPKGTKPGDWLQVQVSGDKLVSAKADPKETAARRQEIAELTKDLFVNSNPVQKQKACIDRFEKLENGKTLAVVLVGNEEKVINVPLESLPAGVKEGDWLNVDVQGDKIVGAQVNKQETVDRRNWIQKLFASLFG